MFKILFLGLIFLSATPSGCEMTMGSNSYLNAPQKPASNDYRTLAYNDAVQAGIPPDAFVRQINEESAFNPYALSYAGAQGIAQIIPSTAASWKVNPWDPVASLAAAADHMHWYYQHYGYDYSKALVCYNAGCSTLDWAMAHCLDYYWCIPQQTRTYIDIITGAHHG